MSWGRRPCRRLVTKNCWTWLCDTKFLQDNLISFYFWELSINWPKNISSRIWSDKGFWLGYWKQKSKPKEIWFGWNVFPNQENTQVWMFFPPNNKIVGIIRAVKRKPAFQFWQMIYLSSGQCTLYSLSQKFLGKRDCFSNQTFLHVPNCLLIHTNTPNDDILYVKHFGRCTVFTNCFHFMMKFYECCSVTLLWVNVHIYSNYSH